VTAPIWIASPPEVHSALLSSGPGPGALLAASAAWSTLSAEYTSVADELAAVLAAAQAGAWEGPSAESYVAAHAPYLAWLARVGATSAEKAAEHEAMAAAYTTALAAMPTLPELATNHVVHGVLAATNFFGINTIPIALNEADYVRMWVQAATTMSMYQAVSDATLASTPQTTPAPPIVKSDAATQAQSAASNPLQGALQQVEQLWQNLLQEYQSLVSNQLNPFTQFENLVNNPRLTAILEKLGIGNETVAHDPVVDNALDNFIANVLKNFGYNWNPAQGTLNGLEYDSYTNPTMAAFWVARSLELTEDFQQFFVYLQSNPVLAFQYLISLELYDFPLHLAEIFTLVGQPELLVAVLPIAAAPLASAAGLAGLAGLAAIPPPPVAPTPVPVPLPMPPPVAGPTFSAPATLAGSAPAPSPTPSSPSPPAAPAPPPPPAPAPAAAFFPPFLVGPPGMGTGSGMSARASSSAKRKAPEPDSAAAAAAAAAREAARARRRRRSRSRERGHGDEYMDMNVDVDPDWEATREPVAATAASERGAGALGFAGTATKKGSQTSADATGLTTLPGDEFGGGPRMPMLPGTWGPDAEDNDA
jgi:PPE-repeat protein